jgi:hypothetical protein
MENEMGIFRMTLGMLVSISVGVLSVCLLPYPVQIAISVTVPPFSCTH